MFPAAEAGGRTAKPSSPVQCGKLKGDLESGRATNSVRVLRDSVLGIPIIVEETADQPDPRAERVGAAVHPLVDAGRAAGRCTVVGALHIIEADLVGAEFVRGSDGPAVAVHLKSRSLALRNCQIGPTEGEAGE